METHIMKKIIAIIRNEQKRRSSLLEEKDPDIAYDQWVFKDIPFLNELCLMLLVTLRHQVERELIWLTSRASDDGKEIDNQQFQHKVKKLRKGLSWDWKEINKRLKLKSCKNYECVHVLRLLSNLYKHDPSMEPDKDLLNKLNLETGVNYVSLPESGELHERLAEFIGLEKEADFCDIAERFIDIASDFLSEVKNQIKLSKIERGKVSLNLNNFAR